MTRGSSNRYENTYKASSDNDSTNESNAGKAKEKASKVSRSRVGIKLQVNYQNTTFTILSGMRDILEVVMACE